MRLGLVLAAARRESRGARGRLLFFTACLALGSFAVVGVAGLTGAVRAAIARQSQELLGGDVWIRARAPLPDALTAELERVRSEGVGGCAVRTVQTMARATANST